MVDLTNSFSDEDGFSVGGEGKVGKKGIVWNDIKAEGRKDGIKVVLDKEGNVKVDMKQEDDIGIEDFEYDSDGEIVEDMI